MTYLKPNQKLFNPILIILIGFLALQVTATIFIYSQNASLRYKLSSLGRDINNLDASTIELEKSLYSLLDLKNADGLIAEFGLVRDVSPEFGISLSNN